MTATEEKTMYTLEELEALNWVAHAKALENVGVWSNGDGDYCSWITEDINLELENEKPVADVTVASWDYARSSMELKGDINLAAFMRAKKLCNKYRALWYLVKSYGNSLLDANYAFDTDRQHDFDDRFATRMEECIYLYSDIEDEQPARYRLLLEQAEAVAKAMDAYIYELKSKMFKQMTAEIEWRYSAEFAKQEAADLELRFDEEGKIVDFTP